MSHGLFRGPGTVFQGSANSLIVYALTLCGSALILTMHFTGPGRFKDGRLIWLALAHSLLHEVFTSEPRVAGSGRHWVQQSRLLMGPSGS